MEFFAEYYDILESCLSAPVQGRGHRSSSLTEAGEATLPRILSARRMELYWPVLWERMRPGLAEKYPLAAISAGAVPGQARREAFCRALEDAARDGGAALYVEYPELERLDRHICAGFERFLDEVFQTLEEKRAEIAETFFGGRDFGRVVAARLPSPTDARTRPGSRTTLYLETEGGGFYFKPRICTAERLYARLMERFFPEVGTTCKTVVGSRASFAERIGAAPLASESEAAAYYRRMGAMAAVFYALQTSDLHSGNFIAQGPRPVPVDLEILLGTLPAGASARLPGIGGLSLLQMDGESEHHSPLYAARGNAKELGRLPQLDGRPVSVLDEEDAFLAGFADGCRRVMESAGGWIAVIREYPDMPLRVLPRTHRMYGVILRGMLKPAQLRSPQARDAWLERVWEKTPEAWRNTVREMERECFLGLDFPDFYILAGEPTIRRPDGEPAVEGTMRPPLECAVERLGSLSEEIIQTAREDLRGILAALRAREKSLE